MKKTLVFTLAMTAILAGCTASAPSVVSASSATEETIHLAAAASLTKAFEEQLIPMFEEQNPGIKVEGTFASSGDLKTQIEEGFDADVFFSAAVKQMNGLTEEGLIAEDTRADLLENKLVLVVPAASDLQISSFEDILTVTSVAVGDPESVPAGQYAQEALTNLGVWEQMQSLQVSYDAKVTDVLAHVAEGSADAGFVYASDAATNADVRVAAEAPEGSLQTPVLYPAAVTANSEHKEAAQALLDFLKSDEAMQVFEQYGFASNLN